MCSVVRFPAVKDKTCAGNRLNGPLGPLSTLTNLAYLDVSGNQSKDNLHELRYGSARPLSYIPGLLFTSMAQPKTQLTLKRHDPQSRGPWTHGFLR